MEFVLLIMDDANAEHGKAEIDKIVKQHHAFAGELNAAKVMIGGNRLRSDTSRITRKGDKRIVTDGPFAETKEVLGGYYMIQCASRKEAIEWAKKLPIFEGDAVMVQQVWA